MSRGILATATARVKPGVDGERLRGAWAEAYADEPFVHLLPEGQWPHTKAVQGSNHVALQLAFDEHAGRVIVSCAIDNLAKGTAGGAIQSMNIALGLDGDRRPDPAGSCPVSVTAAQGFRAAGVTAGLKASGKPGRRAGGQRRPVHGRGGRLHHQTAWRRPRCTGPAQAISDGRADAVVLNSGGANACTGAEGFQNTHATAEKAAARPRGLRRRRAGLLHRPDRRAAAHGQAASRRRGRGRGARRRRRAAAAEAIMTTDTVPKQAVVVTGAG